MGVLKASKKDRQTDRQKDRQKRKEKKENDKRRTLKLLTGARRPAAITTKTTSVTFIEKYDNIFSVERKINTWTRTQPAALGDSDASSPDYPPFQIIQQQFPDGRMPPLGLCDGVLGGSGSATRTGGGRGLLEPLHRDERIPVAISGWLRGLLRLADSRFSGASGCAPATGAALLKPTRPSPRFNHGNQTLRGLHGNTAVSSSLICIIERVHREDE